MTASRPRRQSHDCLSEISPSQKERMVRALHLEGRVVGFLGDGINDSPALKAADVGISVDMQSISQGSADMILLEKSDRGSSRASSKDEGFSAASQRTSRWARVPISATCSASLAPACSCRSCGWRRLGPHQQSAVRFFADSYSDRQGRRGIYSRAAPLGYQQHIQIHGLCWSHQLDIRLCNLRDDAVRI